MILRMIAHHCIRNAITNRRWLVAIKTVQLFVDLLFAPNMVLLTPTVITCEIVIGQILSTVRFVQTVDFGMQQSSRANGIGRRGSSSE